MQPRKGKIRDAEIKDSFAYFRTLMKLSFVRAVRARGFQRQELEVQLCIWTCVKVLPATSLGRRGSTVVDNP